MQHLRGSGRDERHRRRVRAVLPSVGYQLTRRGIRRGRSPVDRVLARSEAKTLALTADRAGRAPQPRRPAADAGALRPRARRRHPAGRPRGVVDEQAGSALLALEHLARRRAAPAPPPGHRYDGGRSRGDAARRFRAYVGRARTWSSRRPARGPLDQPRLGAVGDAVLRGGPLPGPGRHPRTARRGLGRPRDHRAGRPDLGDHQHRRRADPGPGAAHTTRPGRRRSRSPGPSSASARTTRRAATTGTGSCASTRGSTASTPRATWSRASPTWTRRSRRTRRRRSPPSARSTRGCWCAPSSARWSATHGQSGRRTTTRSCTPCGSPPASDRRADGAGAGRAARRRRRGARRPPAPWRPHPVIAVGVVIAAVAFLLNLTPRSSSALGRCHHGRAADHRRVDRGRVLAEDLARPPSIEQVAHAVADALHEVGLHRSEPRR